MGKPVAYVSDADWNKILNYAKSAYEQFSSEIGGMAESVRDKDGDVWIVRPVILKQSVSSANCDLDEASLAQYYAKVAKKHGTVEFLWWHSHANMSAFWSGTDEKTINDNEGKSDHTWSLVVNIKGEHIFQLDVFRVNGIKLHIAQEFLLHIVGKSIPNTIKKEVEKLCQKEPTAIYSGWDGYGRVSKYNNGNQLSIASYNQKPSEDNRNNTAITTHGYTDINDSFLASYGKAHDMVENALLEYHAKSIGFASLVKLIETANRVSNSFKIPKSAKDVELYAYQMEKTKV